MTNTTNPQKKLLIIKDIPAVYALSRNSLIVNRPTKPRTTALANHLLNYSTRAPDSLVPTSKQQQAFLAGHCQILEHGTFVIEFYLQPLPIRPLDSSDPESRAILEKRWNAALVRFRQWPKAREVLAQRKVALEELAATGVYQGKLMLPLNRQSQDWAFQETTFRNLYFMDWRCALAFRHSWGPELVPTEEELKLGGVNPRRYTQTEQAYAASHGLAWPFVLPPSATFSAKAANATPSASTESLNQEVFTEKSEFDPLFTATLCVFAGFLLFLLVKFW